MTISSSFLPIDRLHVLARGPDSSAHGAIEGRVMGAALLADVSGFTALADALAGALGPQRGAEELTRHMNRVFGALLGAVHQYGGSVIGFSGDAITCWFDAGNPGKTKGAASRAATCALEMQRAVKGFARIDVGEGAAVTIAAKVAVATGSARRVRVGDRAIQYVDALAGATLDRLAAAERTARREEVLLDSATARALEGEITAREYRSVHDASDGAVVVVLDAMIRPAQPAPWPSLAEGAVDYADVRPWLLGPVHERLFAGAGELDAARGLELLAALRPAIAVFVRFDGIDYDADEGAGAKLDAFVTWAQRVLARYEGTLIDLTIGDKGSYLYGAFGAPRAHEDDAERALRAALELREARATLPFLASVHIGVSGGRTRAGAIGGPTRRAYTVTGNDVNVAARLMQKAGPHEILVAAHVLDATRGAFDARTLGAVALKGKSERVEIAALDGVRESAALRTERGRVAEIRMVGREDHLARVLEKLARATRGAGEIVAITAEAGIGKSRLLLEVLREAKKRGFEVHAGDAQSFGTTATYLAWHGVWRSMLGFEGGLPAERREAALGEALAKIDPALLPRLPLLGAAVGVPIGDNDLTKQFEAKLRRDSLEALLTTCLRACAARRPILIAIEDAHWMDALSIDLLESIGRAVAGMPVLLVVTSRTEEGEGRAIGRIARLPHFTEVRLRELARDAAGAAITQLVRARLGSNAPVPERFVELVHARSEGNPFLAGELVEDLFDRGITPERALEDEAIELPSNVASAILGRMDRLPTGQQLLLKVASVIGRLYVVAWLWGVYPELGTPSRVSEELNALEQRDLVAVGAGPGQGSGDASESAYSFKHSLIQEVIYESLPFEMRARLHGALAKWLEERREGSIDLLAFHYGRTANVEKQREYFRKAGDAAAARYANEAAAGYYAKLVEVAEGVERAEALLGLGLAKAAVSKWDEAEREYTRAIDIVALAEPCDLRARLYLALSGTYTMRSRYEDSARLLEDARGDFVRLDDRGGQTTVLIETAKLLRLQSRFDESRSALNESLAMEGSSGDKRRIASAYHYLGTLAIVTMDLPNAQHWWAKSMEVMEELGDKAGIANLTVNSALPAWSSGRYDEARALLEKARPLCVELGMSWSVSRADELLGLVLSAQGDFSGARDVYRSALNVLRDLGASREMAELMVSMLATWPIDGTDNNCVAVLRVGGAGLGYFERMGIAVPPLVQTNRDRSLPLIRERIGGEAVDAALNDGRAMGWSEAVEYALGGTS